jgi:pimeloyl-ACP methyl ester carboxylesterase
MRTALAVLTVGISLTLAAGAPSMASPISGSWTGSYSLRGEDSITFLVAGRRATVALGAGHASAQPVAFSGANGRIRFQLPGRPGPVVFEGRLRKGRIEGSVRQAGRRGDFRAHRGSSPRLLAQGMYANARAVIDTPFGAPRLVDLDTGEVRGLYSRGSAFDIGSGFATRAPSAGAASFGATGAVIGGQSTQRLRFRQLEVRFQSGGASLAGTLTIPPGAGRRPAVAFVHGSGPQTRAYLPDLGAMLLHRGVAVLAYDKRGIGQSTGIYPGESPIPSTIDDLARDAEAAVRFLAAQPEIDPARVGLAGHSQAGWIMPRAGAREPKVRFLVTFAGPTVTADESDLYQDLTGQGDRPQGQTDEAIDAEVLARGPSGFDPMPSIRSLRIPALWVYGGLDQHIPTRLSVRLLEPLAADAGLDFSVVVLPNANHALVETQTGLTAEMLRSNTFAPGLFARVGEWLRARGLGG